MKKCLVKESFSGLYCHGTAGQIIELADDDAKGLVSANLIEILPDEEQPEPPMAYETSKQAIEAETATIKRKGRPKK